MDLAERSDRSVSSFETRDTKFTASFDEMFRHFESLADASAGILEQGPSTDVPGQHAGAVMTPFTMTTPFRGLLTAEEVVTSVS